jgi:hypothetical protein
MGSLIADTVGGTPPPYSFDGGPLVEPVTTSEQYNFLVAEGVIPEGKSVYRLNIDAGVPFVAAVALGGIYEVGVPTKCMPFKIFNKISEIENLIFKIQKMPHCEKRTEDVLKALKKLRELLGNHETGELGEIDNLYKQLREFGLDFTNKNINQIDILDAEDLQYIAKHPNVLGDMSKQVINAQKRAKDAQTHLCLVEPKIDALLESGTTADELGIMGSYSGLVPYTGTKL